MGIVALVRVSEPEAEHFTQRSQAVCAAEKKRSEQGDFVAETIHTEKLTVVPRTYVLMSG